MKKLLFFIITITVLTCTNLFAQTQLYRVEVGDTFESISKEFGISVEALKKANPNVKTIFVGMKINIPEATEQLKSTNDNKKSIFPKNDSSAKVPSRPHYETENKSELITGNSKTSTYKTEPYGRFGAGMLFDEGDLSKNAVFMEWYFSARNHILNPIFWEYGLGYNCEFRHQNQEYYKYNATLHSLHVPVLLGVSTDTSIGTALYFGPYVDFTFCGKSETEYMGNKTTQWISDNENFNRFLFGIKTGAEIDFNSFRLGICFSIGLTSQYKGVNSNQSRLLFYLSY